MNNRQLDFYRHLAEGQAEQLPDNLRTRLFSRIEKYGYSRIASDRICKLRQWISHGNLPLLQFVLLGFMALLGALLYSATATVVTALLSIGTLRKLAIPVLGAVFALIGEDRSKRAITSVRLWSRRRSAEQYLQHQQRLAHNFLDSYFYKCQIFLLRKVEHQNPSVVDGLLAMLMILVESAAAYFLVLDAQGPMLAFFMATVPAVVIFLTAAAASEYIDMPQELTKILREYEAYVHIPTYPEDNSDYGHGHGDGHGHDLDLRSPVFPVLHQPTTGNAVNPFRWDSASDPNSFLIP